MRGTKVPFTVKIYLYRDGEIVKTTVFDDISSPEANILFIPPDESGNCLLVEGGCLTPCLFNRIDMLPFDEEGTRYFLYSDEHSEVLFDTESKCFLCENGEYEDSFEFSYSDHPVFDRIRFEHRGNDLVIKVIT